MASNQFSMNGEDWKKVLQAVVYSAVSSGLAALVVVLSQPGLLSWRVVVSAVLVPAINGALVALKKFADGEKLSPPSEPNM